MTGKFAADGHLRRVGIPGWIAFVSIWPILVLSGFTIWIAACGGWTTLAALVATEALIGSGLLAVPRRSRLPIRGLWGLIGFILVVSAIAAVVGTTHLIIRT